VVSNPSEHGDPLRGPLLDARPVEAVVGATEWLLLLLVVEQEVALDAAERVAPDEALAVRTADEAGLDARAVLRRKSVVGLGSML
jgi:hypothetical protein